MTEDDIRSLLREMRDEPVPPDSLVRVRNGVEKAQNHSAASWWRLFAGVAALAALVALMFMVPSSGKVQPPPPVVAKITPPPFVEQAPARPVAVHRRVAVRPRPPAAKPALEDVVVRIETADPDIVILLLGD